MPFTIEYVVLLDAKQPSVIERITSFASRLAFAEQSARSGFERIRELRPETPPEGFQICDSTGDVVLRSWEKAADVAS